MKIPAALGIFLLRHLSIEYKVRISTHAPENQSDVFTELNQLIQNCEAVV